MYVVGPVHYWQLGIYDSLHSGLLQAWEASGHCIGDLVADEQCWKMIESVTSLLPRLDAPDKAGFPLGEDYLWLEKFLFRDLVDLHHLDPVLQPSRREEDKDLPPVPSSGDPFADMLADLSLQHGLRDAMEAMKGLDLNTLNKVVFRISEASRDPKERQEEELTADYEEWKAANPFSHLPKRKP